MTKVKLKSEMPPMALPVCLLGSEVNGKPTFCTIAWFTVIDDEPPQIGLVLAKERYTREGIANNGTFSVNLPSAKVVQETDYCGINSGYKVDKSGVFKTFQGELKTAPMIEGCPLTMECQYVDTIEFEGTDMIIGEVIGVYADESLLSGDKLDLNKTDLLFLGMTTRLYYRLGGKVADAYTVGKNFHP